MTDRSPPPSIRGSSPGSARSSRPAAWRARRRVPTDAQDVPAQAEDDGLHRRPAGGLLHRKHAKARSRRASLASGVPVFKRIDTCAAEFEAQTPTCIPTYEAPAMGDVECEARPSDRKKVVILGGGPNRIGQGSSSTIAAAMPVSR